MQARGLSATDVQNAFANQSQITPAGTIKIGSLQYVVDLNNAGQTIESAALLKPYGSAGGARKIDDFLQSVAAGAASHEDAFERTPGSQGFDYGVNSNQDGQTSIIPRCARSSVAPARRVRGMG